MGTNLKIARILPLKEQGKPSELFDSYRPINNLCPLNKVVEEAIRTRIDHHLNRFKVIPNNSHGARTAHSTLTAIQEVERTIKTNKAAGEVTAVLATDLTTAYDLIDHSILLEKFEHIGLRGTPYLVIQSYLTERQQFVDVQGYTSALMPCRQYSVIQGGKLSGQFFGVFTLEMSQITKLANNEDDTKYITGK